MNKIKIKGKKHHLLWDTASGEILVDIEATNPLTVTECTRPGIKSMGFDTKKEKDKQITDAKLKHKEIENQPVVNQEVEYVN